MKKLLIPRTLKNKFLFITLILMLLLGIGTSALSYILYSRNLTTYSIQTAETNLKILQNTINTNLKNVENLTEWCCANSDISNYLYSTSYNLHNSALTKQASELLTKKYVSNPAAPYISRIIIASKSSSKFLQETSAAHYSEERNMIQIIQELPFFEKLIRSPVFSFDSGIQTDPFTITSEKMLPVIQPINDSRNHPSGFLYLQISLFLFSDPLVEFYKQDNTFVYLTVDNSTYKVTEDLLKQVNDTSFEVKSLSYDYLDDDTQIHKILSGSNPGIYVTVPLAANGCSLSIPISTETVNIFTKGYLTILLFILLFLVLMGGLILLLFSHNVTQPIDLLKQRITAISGGDFSLDSSIEWDNELGDIGKNINCLATDIDSLMEQRIFYERQKKDYEYQILQSQINPHFLYNTLNSIKWMATAQNATGIAEMTTALAHLLKNIAKGTSSIITLRDELHLLELYFVIQKYRYGGAIVMEQQVEQDELLNFQILRFTLQPIVENAIFHGIEPKGQGGRIDIHIFINDDTRLQIDVTDNGVGMDTNTIEEVLSGKAADHSSFFKQVGIGSVNNRIKYNFGEEYGLTIQSVLDEYTKISIVLPLTESKGEIPHDEDNHC